MVPGILHHRSSLFVVLSYSTVLTKIAQQLCDDTNDDFQSKVESLFEMRSALAGRGVARIVCEEFTVFRRCRLSRGSRDLAAGSNSRFFS